MLEHFYSLAAVVVVQSMARRLYSPKMDLFDGVINGENLRCAVSSPPSLASLPMCIELPRRAPRPPAVARECLPPVPAGLRPSQLTKSTES
jgi:hypothetical protein